MKSFSVLLIVIQLLNYLNIHSQIKSSGCTTNEKISVCISDVDCVNCQNLLNPILAELRKRNCKLNFVFSGIPKRILKEYYSSKITENPADNVLHYNDVKLDELNWDGSRSCVVTHDGIVVNRYKLDEFLNHLNHSKSEIIQLTDSIDLTPFWGSHSSKLYMDTSKGFFIYNDVRNILYGTPKNDSAIIARFNFIPFLEKWNDTLINFNKELEKIDIENNKQKLKSTPFGNVKCGQPYITDRYIYLPVTKFFLKRGFISDTASALVPYSFMFRFDKNFNLLNLYFFKSKLLANSKNLYNSLSYSLFIDDTTFMMNVSSMSKDSLVAIYSFSDNDLNLQSVINLKYPSYFEKLSPRGYPIVYPLGYANLDDGGYYFIPREQTLYSTINDTIVTKKLELLNCPYESECYIEYLGKFGGKNIGVTYKNKITYMSYFSSGNLMQSKSIPKLLLVAGVRNKSIHTYEVNDEKVTYYKYQLR